MARSQSPAEELTRIKARIERFQNKVIKREFPEEIALYMKPFFADLYLERLIQEARPTKDALDRLMELARPSTMKEMHGEILKDAEISAIAVYLELVDASSASNLNP